MSPNMDLYNFDTFGWSLLNVYIVVTNEGWSTIMQDIQVGFSVSKANSKFIANINCLIINNILVTFANWFCCFG